MDYAVVEFQDTKLVEIVPVTWIAGEDTQCHWPNNGTADIHKLVREKQPPNKNWGVFSIQVIAKTDLHTRAAQKAKNADDTPDLQTEPEEPEPKRRKQETRHCVESDDEDQSASGSHSIGQGDFRVEETRVPSIPDLVSDHSPLGTFEPTSPQQPLPESEMGALRGDIARLETLMHTIIHMVQEVQATQQIMSGELMSFRRTQQPVENHEIPDISFPINSLEGLRETEKILNKETSDKLINVFGDLGGRTIDETVRRIMSQVMTNDLSLQFNMTGRNGKNAFEPTNLFHVVHHSVKKNPTLSGVTQKQVEVSLSKWFLGSRDRNGNRAIRAEETRRRQQALF